MIVTQFLSQPVESRGLRPDPVVISTEFIYLSPFPFSLLRAPTKGLVRTRLGESQTILLLTWDAHASQIPRIHTFLPNLLLPLFLVDNILTHPSFRLETPICLTPLLPSPCLIGCPCTCLSNACFLSLAPLSQPWISASSCAVNCCPGRQFFLCPSEHFLHFLLCTATRRIFPKQN